MDPSEQRPLERCVFELGGLARGGLAAADPEDLERQFRSAVLRIQSAGRPRLPKGSSFEIVAYSTKPAKEAGLQSWMDESIA